MLNPNDIELYAKQIGFQINGLLQFTEILKEAKQSLDENRITQENILKNEIYEIKAQLSTISDQLEKLGLDKIDKYELQMNFIKNKIQKEWPIAIDHDYFNIDKKTRAESIVDMVIMEHLQGIKFLDYKCDTGHIAKEASNRGTTLSVGYDDTQEWEFSNSENLFYTCNFEDVRQKGPFDVVLLYDVLDHAINPEDVLSKVKQVLSNKGRIYVRCHPWCSRHGGHLHEEINKAYLHLILNEDELIRLGGYKIKKTNKLFRPIQTYHKWFETVGLSIQNELVIESEPESFFFENAPILDRLQNHWKTDAIKPYISIDFVDYILEANSKDQRVF